MLMTRASAFMPQQYAAQCTSAADPRVVNYKRDAEDELMLVMFTRLLVCAMLMIRQRGKNV